MKKVLAVASGGGHWVQLMRLRPAFSGAQLEYLTTDSGYSSEVPETVHVVPDASGWDKLGLVKMFAATLWVLLKVRPHVVVTTGAAPGLAAIMIGRVLGARTVWIDSIANAERLSKSGHRARRWATVRLTQWKHITADEAVEHWGSVL